MVVLMLNEGRGHVAAGRREGRAGVKGGSRA